MRITFVFNSKYAWATLKKMLSCAGPNNPTITTKHSFSPSNILHLPTSSKIHPKQAAHQQVGSSRDISLSSLTTKSTKTQSSIKNLLNSLQYDRCSFIFYNPTSSHRVTHCCVTVCSMLVSFIVSWRRMWLFYIIYFWNNAFYWMVQSITT